MWLQLWVHWQRPWRKSRSWLRWILKNVSIINEKGFSPVWRSLVIPATVAASVGPAARKAIRVAHWEKHHKRVPYKIWTQKATKHVNVQASTRRRHRVIGLNKGAAARATATLAGGFECLVVPQWKLRRSGSKSLTLQRMWRCKSCFFLFRAYNKAARNHQCSTKNNDAVKKRLVKQVQKIGSWCKTHTDHGFSPAEVTRVVSAVTAKLREKRPVPPRP